METAVLRTFLHIVDEGSFAGAARRMGISKSLCSKYISDLEETLGARLLTRSTRSVKPTAVGLDYSNKVREILAQLDAASETVRAVSEKASGPLKIGAPIFYTLRVLQPHLLRFIEQHPDIQLEAVLDDERADLVGDGFDAVIRIGELDDSGLFARHLHDMRVMLVASPGYLADKGVPAEPADLSEHHSIYYTNIRGTGTWPFRHGNEVVHQKIVPVFQTNNGEMVRAAALNGKGIAMLPVFIIEEDLREGRLVPVLTDFFLPELPVNLVYPSRRHMTAALKVFMEFVAGLRLV